MKNPPPRGLPCVPGGQGLPVVFDRQIARDPTPAGGKAPGGQHRAQIGHHGGVSAEHHARARAVELQADPLFKLARLDQRGDACRPQQVRTQRLKKGRVRGFA